MGTTNLARFPFNSVNSLSTKLFIPKEIFLFNNFFTEVCRYEVSQKQQQKMGAQDNEWQAY